MRDLFLPLARLAALTGFAVAVAACGSTPEDGSTSETSEDLSSNQQSAYEYFVGKGLKDFQAAAIVGNLIQESSVSPTSVQAGGPGRGIAQWSVGGRWNQTSHDNVDWYAGTMKASATSLNLQLEFIWYELETFSVYGLAKLRSATTISQATVAFQTDFEICGACDQTRRITDAKQVLASYGGAGSGGTGSSGGGTTSAGCYSTTLGKQMPANACVQSKSDSAWYQCDDGAWVARAGDPTACNGTYPL